LTLIVNKFDYAALSRRNVENKRKYETPDGSLVSSVTTILDATKDKTHLEEWRRRVGHAKAQQITTEAANRGTRMHKYIEDYIATGEWPIPGTNPYAQKAHAMATRIKVHALSDVNEIWGSEVALYVPHLYAGTTDLVGLYKGNPFIGDFKQSNKPKKAEWIEDYFLQMVAYAEAHNELYDTNIREGHIFMCSPGLDPEAIGGEIYQQFDLWPDEYDSWKNKWYDRLYQYYENIK